MLDVKNIRLSQDELARCIEFSQRSAPNQQAIEFGQRSTKARSTREIARDNLIGKIAEVAFSKMMKENYGIDVPLDFNYYPRGQWDNQDGSNACINHEIGCHSYLPEEQRVCRGADRPFVTHEWSDSLLEVFSAIQLPHS